jgi:hypothetical protein
MTRIKITLEFDRDEISDEDVYEYLKELIENGDLNYEKEEI